MATKAHTRRGERVEVRCPHEGVAGGRQTIAAKLIERDRSTFGFPVMREPYVPAVLRSICPARTPVCSP